MFSKNIILECIAFVSSLSYYYIRDTKNTLKSSLFFYTIPLLGLIINGIFSHNGASIILMVNNNAITVESLFYGFVSGLTIASVIVWFASFTQIMTTDKLLYVFGSISPKLSLILSMTLRYIPLYKKQIQKTNRAQKALGLYKDDTLIDKLSGGLRIFSIMVTWALENGVITADSMTARGYGIGKRSFFAIFKWAKRDYILLFTSLALFAITFIPFVLGQYTYTFYPYIEKPQLEIIGCIGYIAYALLSFIPEYIQFKEDMTWKSLQSKI